MAGRVLTIKIDELKVETTATVVEENQTLEFVRWLDHANTVISERIRSVEQIKRFYAIIMGFAATRCLTNVYTCAVASQDSLSDIISLSVQGFTFLSLATLFVLGSERLLDLKYLQVGCQVPSAMTLLFDLVSLALTAAWFIVLANTFPLLVDNKLTQKIPDVQVKFCQDLVVLCCIDIALVGLQLWTLHRRRHKGTAEPGQPGITQAHVRWLIINAVTGVALYFALGMGSQHVSLTIFSRVLEMNTLTLFLAVIATARFLADFISTFSFYFPPRPIPAQPG